MNHCKESGDDEDIEVEEDFDEDDQGDEAQEREEVQKAEKNWWDLDSED